MAVPVCFQEGLRGKSADERTKMRGSEEQYIRVYSAVDCRKSMYIYHLYKYTNRTAKVFLHILMNGTGTIDCICFCEDLGIYCYGMRLPCMRSCLKFHGQTPKS